MRRFSLVPTLALASLVALAACSDEGDGTYTLTITNAAVSIGQGVKDTVPISLARAGFSKLITLTVEGLPTGVTAKFLPSTVPGNISDAGLELTVAPTASLATTVLTVKANASGVTEQVATMDLTVSLTGSYTLSSFGFPATAAQGGGASGTVLVTRADGHGDFVTLAATNVPSGVTATFNASPTSGNGASLSLAVGAGVAPGAYPITVTGTAAGLSDQTTQVTLNVIAPPATASFSLPFCATAVPSWLAYQNTGYQWQTVTPTNGVFTFDATSSFAVAYVFVINSGGANETDLYVHYTTRTELAGKDTRDCAGADTLTGSISGATSGQSARVAMGAIVATPTQASPSFQLNRVPDRSLDLVATKGTITNTASNLQIVPDLLLIQRGLNPPNKASLGALDFAASGFAPTSTNLTVGNLTANDIINIGNTFWTGNQTYGVVHTFQPVGSTNTLYSMPAARFQAGDLHELLVETFQPGFTFGRVNVAYLGAITSDRTESLSPNLPVPTATAVSTSPYVRMRGQVAVQAEYPTATRFLWFQDGGASADRLILVVQTAGYLGATPSSTWDVTIPDFGSVSGLSNNWLPSTSNLVYQAEAYSSPGPVLFGGIPSPGDIVKVAYRVNTTGALGPGGNALTLRATLKRGVDSRQYFRR